MPGVHGFGRTEATIELHEHDFLKYKHRTLELIDWSVDETLLSESKLKSTNKQAIGNTWKENRAHFYV